MATVAQISANRANAQVSTGPRTEEGKARAALNSLKHGFASKILHLSDEDRQEFEILQTGLVEDIRPEGALEIEIFRRLLTHAWNLRRIELYESRALAETDLFAANPDQFLRLERCARYRRDVERGFYRALSELKRLQTQRAALLRQEADVVEALHNTAPLAELTRLTKRTDSFLVQDPAGSRQSQPVHPPAMLPSGAARAALNLANGQQKPLPGIPLQSE